MSNDGPDWLDSEKKRAEKQVKQGKTVTNPDAAKDVKKTVSKGKKYYTSTNYLRIAMSEDIERRFRQIIAIRTQEALETGEKITQGIVFAEMLEHYEKKLKI